MKKIVLIILAIAAVLAIGLDWPDPSITIDGMKIQGPEQFREDVLEGLNLLKEKAPEYYDMVVGNIKKVWYSEDDFNGMYMNGSYGLNKESYTQIINNGNNKCYYMALTLAHESCHAQRMGNGKFSKNNIEKEEWLAVKTEKEVARLIDAPKSIKDWLEQKFDTRWWEKSL